MSRPARLPLFTVVLLLVASTGLALASITGVDGHEAVRQIDRLDADVVTVHEARSFNAPGWSTLAVDSAGLVHLVVPTYDGAYLHQEVVTFSPDDAGGQGIARLFGVRSVDDYIRALLVVPADTVDGTGASVLHKDHLLVLVDGWDEAADVSYRELWQVDPADPTNPSVLYRKSPEPTRYPLSVGGVLAVTVAADGTVFLQEESSGDIVAPGSIRALRYDDGVGAYVEDPVAVTTANQTTGQVLAGPDGYLYGFARSTPDTDSPATDRILRIDPDATDAWTTHATFGRKFGERHPSWVSLVFDSDGRLFLMAGVFERGRSVRFVAAVDAGAEVDGRGRVVESEALLKHHLAAGPAGQLYVVEREVAGAEHGDPELDAVYEIRMGSGGDGGGGKGSGKGKGPSK